MPTSSNNRSIVFLVSIRLINLPGGLQKSSYGSLFTKKSFGFYIVHVVGQVSDMQHGVVHSLQSLLLQPRQRLRIHVAHIAKHGEAGRPVRTGFHGREKEHRRPARKRRAHMIAFVIRNVQMKKIKKIRLYQNTFSIKADPASEIFGRLRTKSVQGYMSFPSNFSSKHILSNAGSSKIVEQKFFLKKVLHFYLKLMQKKKVQFYELC